jgi:PEP-CTERM motif-containing protein
MKVGAVLALAMVFAVATPKKADAAFVALICNDALCDGAGGDIIVVDNAAGDSLNLTNGAISISGAVGGLTVTVNTSQSKPVLGSPASPSMDITYTATGIGTAYFYATDTDFTGLQLLLGNVNGNFSGAATTTAYIAGGNDNTNFNGPGNTNLDLTGLVSASSNVNPTNINISHLAASVSPYFLTIGLQINRTTAGTSTGDYLVSAVPEPASLTLLGMGLLAGAVRRRYQRKA